MRAVTWAIVAMLLPRVLGAIPTRTPRTGGVGDTLSVAIVCHDLESVEVTWGPGSAHHGLSANLSLEFRYGNQVPQPCPHYFLLDSVRAGCVLPMGKGLLEVVLREGGGAKLFSRKKKASAWLRPRPPWNVTLSWVGDTVAVSCPSHSYPGLEYEVQHRDDFDPEWQSTSAPFCNLTVGGLDPGRCYDFRVRATPQDFYYGPEARPSKWTGVASLQGVGPTGSCTGPTLPRTPGTPTPPLALACGLAVALLTLVLLLALLRMRRVKEALLPGVPDPRGSFPGLFEKHHGNFQAWIADSQAAVPTVPEQDKDDDVIRPQTKGVETQEEDDVIAPGSPCLGGGALMSVGGASFLMGDSGYTTL
ncbi:thymic stromal-derived lymphopoietin, receptor [Rattus norvegicus]|uniref:Cytokine receptor-like factor 2 n=2 Tax=Rattus norvegicus TaxID=10116 RepID=Q6AZ53_RAT|nr:cytokine receptor-like factor 2 precursor [Rattus norvegicus]AAH78740.1 Cytokine receptor-like factor 2 [Rattus norvegicus]EDL84499.1 thymic stromal-derived lymphopoietin, receptor [Rattus norvegicus]|eukprot:NP_604460.2 cytokine receptor-like factor 2 precursor [Rattus norvegicus]